MKVFIRAVQAPREWALILGLYLGFLTESQASKYRFTPTEQYHILQEQMDEIVLHIEDWK